LALVRPAPLSLIRHRHDFGVQVEKKNRETTKYSFRVTIDAVLPSSNKFGAVPTNAICFGRFG
jgi:hypothetical protein